MRLVEQWRRIERELPADWAEARLALSVPHDERALRGRRAARPGKPRLAGDELRLVACSAPAASARSGPRAAGEARRGAHPRHARAPRHRRASARGGAAARVARRRLGEALATLPADWSDLYCELELTSSDYLDGAALLLAPLNPAAGPGQGRVPLPRRAPVRLRRVAGDDRRCLERVDEAGIRGRVRILRALSDTHNVATQGPVWHVEGKAV